MADEGDDFGFEEEGEDGYGDYIKQRDAAYEKADKFSSRHHLLYALAVVVVVILVVVLVALAFVDDAKEAFSYTEEDVRAALEEEGEDFGYRKTVYNTDTEYVFLGFDCEPSCEESGILNSTPLGMEFCYMTSAPEIVLYRDGLPYTIEAEEALYGYKIIFSDEFSSDGEYAIVYGNDTYSFVLDREAPVILYENGVVSVSDNMDGVELYVRFPGFSTFSLCETTSFALPSYAGSYEVYGLDMAGNETEHLTIDI